ncbi:MAG: hypothetical protein ABIH52_01150 [Candidatus Aenigmatarchaeota archaeon]
MTSMTMAIPKEVKQKMKEFPEINWSEVARQAFMQKIRDMEFMREFKKRSDMTEKDALELGRKVSNSLGTKYKRGG